VQKVSKALLSFIFTASLALAGISAAQAGTVVQVTTPLGNFSVELFDEDAPITVANFLHYVSTGLYNDTFVHRSESNFVIQGGWLRFVESQNAIFPIEVRPPIQNEFKLSNVRGTIAMAKVGGDPNSATSQWFINLANNSFLDSSNGGFTVFGKVLGDGMQIVDVIARLPVVVLAQGITTTPMINFTAPPLKNQNLVEITMAVKSDWPSAFNGVVPDARLNRGNNIGYLRPEDGLIYSCLAIQTNQLPDTLNGVGRFDIAFEVVSLEAGTMRVLKTRPFNPGNALTQSGETPSCSGAFETTTNRYTDVVRVGQETLRVVFDLINAETLVLQLKRLEGL
jgi:cyclophilin family peptidyl-prolyl cis-trans isomerase